VFDAACPATSHRGGTRASRGAARKTHGTTEPGTPYVSRIARHGQRLLGRMGTRAGRTVSAVLCRNLGCCKRSCSTPATGTGVVAGYRSISALAPAEDRRPARRCRLPHGLLIDRGLLEPAGPPTTRLPPPGEAVGAGHRQRHQWPVGPHRLRFHPRRHTPSPSTTTRCCSTPAGTNRALQGACACRIAMC